MLCNLTFTGGIWVQYHYYVNRGSQNRLKKNFLGLGFYTVLWNRGSWVQFRVWHYMLCNLTFTGGIWVEYHYYVNGGSQNRLKKNSTWLGFYTVLWNRGSWIQCRVWHHGIICFVILLFLAVLWERGSWVQFRVWQYMLCNLNFTGGIWVEYHYYVNGGSQSRLKKFYLG